MTHSSSPIPTYPESYWLRAERASYPSLHENLEVDVAVVGGGIAGITSAYLLAKEGKSVVLLEADQVLGGTTGHTTAKISAQHGLIYEELIQHIGEEDAKLYYESNRDALHFIKEAIETEGIACDFTHEDAYIYSVSEKKAHAIEKEWEAYKKLGIDGEILDRIPFSISTTKAIKMSNQAQFHPVNYLRGLLETFTQLGGQVFEHTVCIDVEDEETAVKVITKKGPTVTCQHVVAATHFPFYDGNGLYFARMEPERSYTLAVKSKETYPGGMYLSADDPKRSLRSTEYNGEKLILVGGENHKTGEGIETSKHYEHLLAFAEETVGVDSIPFRWSAQDLLTLDKIPYIGYVTKKKTRVLVATGFQKWGMTLGTVAGKLVTDIICDRANPYKELYDPSRFHADPSIKKFMKMNSDVAYRFFEGKLDFLQRKSVDDVGIDKGSPVHFRGSRAGAYRDEHGAVHIVDTTCTHLGCECEWNDGERTWDCPCHGSRFSYKGDVVEGPADQPLHLLQSDEK
ncbi:(2Fe-2S)-binding protein [Bacillus coahuilensis p1.1.43]|uniref:(2Fe-2S)-binding protein n=1 Tax=Bacillus coahuilensis p1.1.43 TaxID=1150625 RepID=A0A147K3Z6_9BACI|nr:FAD-dependent oxidoreductase [Bacillus coahuilensis]KUP04003.1 (2Fe-2S)-binding protein [Bacillus coahuilensis p1.1.43]